jgi:hypothetical protein
LQNDSDITPKREPRLGRHPASLRPPIVERAADEVNGALSRGINNLLWGGPVSDGASQDQTFFPVSAEL